MYTDKEARTCQIPFSPHHITAHISSEDKYRGKKQPGKSKLGESSGIPPIKWSFTFHVCITKLIVIHDVFLFYYHSQPNKIW